VAEFTFDERAVVPRLTEIAAELNRSLQQLVRIPKLTRTAISLDTLERLHDKVLARTAARLPLRRPAQEAAAQQDQDPHDSSHCPMAPQK
jgi:hypothetical protein